MASSIASAFAIYFVIWWVTLFVTLPFGVQSQAESSERATGTDPGAPLFARMGVKLIWTTAISAIIFGSGLAAYRAGCLNIERITRTLGFPF